MRTFSILSKQQLDKTIAECYVNRQKNLLTRQSRVAGLRPLSRLGYPQFYRLGSLHN
jgi:hypothetical protein